MASEIGKAPEALQQLVADTDTGGRQPTGLTRHLIFGVALAWALFQYWYASPLPFALGFGILNDTQARAIHLSFAIFLAFTAWPAFKRSPRAHVPLTDWVFAAAGAFAAAYIMLFYAELANRPGNPTTGDIVVACIGLVLLLEATRRAVGWPMAVLALVFIGYSMAGPWLPEVISHKGASLNRMLTHMWLTTEGVYGIALGVSATTIFVFVLFGALLDRSGGGNYMMQVSFAALGHLRGGPAKVAVASSALNGMISGSSVANVVSTGIFTIPLMKKAGYGGVKAGAIETMSSVDGQIMPPVMGAAAFLMVEYVGIPYADIVRHAFLPAILSYLGLFYIVHLEALRLGMQPIAQRRARPWRDRILRNLFGVLGTVIVVGALYYAIGAMKALLGAAAPWAVGATVLGLYLVAVWQAARCPDLPDTIEGASVGGHLRDTWPTVRAGLHFIMPIGILVWCLMVEQMSPSLSAFWAVTSLAVLMLTQKPLIALFRGTSQAGMWREGGTAVVEGFHNGARNMIGIGIATATAGIVVGGITLTGLGLRMTEFVEFVSQGNVILMLLFVAATCLVIGLGVPTTANYILVATLMAPVVVELGAQAGMVIPLIAVHMFVFYYGIMADITPPVGLATFAASAISGESSLATGVQGFIYASRTLILPFIWIFNPQLLMISTEGAGEALRVIVASIAAMLLFAAVTMGWFRVKSRWWEQLMLLAAVVLLFRPDMIMNRIQPEYVSAPAAQVYDVARERPTGGRLVMRIEGMTLEGDERSKTVAVVLGGEQGEDGRKRLADAGLQLVPLGDALQVGAVRFGSRAAKSGFEQGWEVLDIQVRADRPSAHWFYLPAIALVLLVWWLQGRRLRDTPPPASPVGAQPAA
ncbi:TRAP transporter 4TM/12TM fusion protein [Melaminivora alkalimesophila]|uniref:TRAP transporter 4TM/12TM fusion protein n=3 Tax=Melaminivora alkalimesophila TaxID=1165852 RepID=A0A317R9N4_9BURK|nr:TRAP transporter permease [Melaminivora alkalimesophila]PWW45669.1 TRAP transporter 4TM/12TM fusion protein [Melaminivora alkalimesophila]